MRKVLVINPSLLGHYAELQYDSQYRTICIMCHYKGLFTAPLLEFVALKSMQKWLRNRKLKIKVSHSLVTLYIYDSPFHIL